jgi:PDZ domain-containing secreted protein
MDVIFMNSTIGHDTDYKNLREFLSNELKSIAASIGLDAAHSPKKYKYETGSYSGTDYERDAMIRMAKISNTLINLDNSDLDVRRAAVDKYICDHNNYQNMLSEKIDDFMVLNWVD